MLYEHVSLCKVLYVNIVTVLFYQNPAKIFKQAIENDRYCLVKCDLFCRDNSF